VRFHVHTFLRSLYEYRKIHCACRGRPVRGCCSTIDVQTDYDPATNFTTLKTFKWVDAKGSDLDKNPLIKARIRDAVIATLKTKGYQQVESGEPDFFVFAHAGAKEKMNVTDWGYSYGAYWDHTGPTAGTSM